MATAIMLPPFQTPHSTISPGILTSPPTWEQPSSEPILGGLKLPPEPANCIVHYSAESSPVSRTPAD